MQDQARAFAAAQQGNIDELKGLIEQNRTLLTVSDSKLGTLLDAASKTWQPYMAIFLLNQSVTATPLTFAELSKWLLPFDIYLYIDQQDNFLIGRPSRLPEKNYCLRLVDAYNQPQLFWQLVDKYLYKYSRHKKYLRDISLFDEDNNRAKAGLEKSKRNLQIINNAIRILYFALGLGVASALPDEQKLREELAEQESVIGGHYGDDLSDDSDNDDPAELKGDVFPVVPSQDFFLGRGTQRTLSQIQKMIGPEDFWLKTKKITPMDAGLFDKLKSFLSQIDSESKLPYKAKITLVDTQVEKLQAIIKNFKEGPNVSGKKDAKEKTTGLRERARIPRSLTVEEQKDLDAINAILRKKGSITQKQLAGIRTRFFIAQYRGINYMEDRWNADSRRYHWKINEAGDEKKRIPSSVQFSENVLKTLPYCFYTELNRDNDFHHVDDLKRALQARAISLRGFFNELDEIGLCVDYTDDSKKSGYAFNSIGDRLQHRFSNGIDSYLNHLQALRNEWIYWRRNLASAHNPAIATGSTPYHALKYGYGLKKYYPHPLLPRYHQDGSLEYLHVGKFYISLHPFTEILSGKGIKRVSHLDHNGQVVIERDISPEKETSFLGLIDEGKVFDQYVIKYPSFKGPYKPIYASKYGLDKQLYQIFQRLIQLSKPSNEFETEARNGIRQRKPGLREKTIELLGEWLCAYHEVLAIEMAALKATRQGGVLVYLTTDNQLSLTPDKNWFTKGPQNRENRLEVHVFRELRQVLYRWMQEYDAMIKDFPGFKVFPRGCFEELWRDDEGMEPVISAVVSEVQKIKGFEEESEEELSKLINEDLAKIISATATFSEDIDEDSFFAAREEEDEEADEEKEDESASLAAMLAKLGISSASAATSSAFLGIHPSVLKVNLPETKIELAEVDTPDDGACLFHSIAQSELLPVLDDEKKFNTSVLKLFGPDLPEGTVQRIKDLLTQYNGDPEFITKRVPEIVQLVDKNFRRNLVKMMKENKDIFATAFYGEVKTDQEAKSNFDRDMKTMAESNCWGGIREIEAASRFLKKHIVVYEKNPDGSLVVRAKCGAGEAIHLVFTESKSSKAMGGNEKRHYHFLIDPLYLRRGVAITTPQASAAAGSSLAGVRFTLFPEIPRVPARAGAGVVASSSSSASSSVDKAFR